MRTFGVVEASPLFDQHLRFCQRVEDLAVQAFISEFSIEAFTIAVFPRTSRLDVERLHIQFAKPIPYGLSDKLWSIVRTNVLRRSVTDEELAEHMEYVLAVELSPDMDRKAFPCIFINDAQHAERSSIVRSIHHEVITPDMVLGRRPKPDTGTVIEPEPPTFRLFLWNFEPFTPPYTLHTSKADAPAILFEQPVNAPVAIAAKLRGQVNDGSR